MKNSTLLFLLELKLYQLYSSSKKVFFQVELGKTLEFFSNSSSTADIHIQCPSKIKKVMDMIKIGWITTNLRIWWSTWARLSRFSNLGVCLSDRRLIVFFHGTLYTTGSWLLVIGNLRPSKFFWKSSWCGI